MSVHLDRFLNVPATRLPEPQGDVSLSEVPVLLDGRQHVDEAGQLVASYLAGGDPDDLIAALGACLLREDRNFHTIQCVEAAVRQHELLCGTDDSGLPLIAAARYLAAHHRPRARNGRRTRSRGDFTVARRSTRTIRFRPPRNRG